MAKKIESKIYYVVGARIALGLIFLWAFFDKLLGLGFTTCRDLKTDTVSTLCDAAWLNGGSPTKGFLQFATKGPLADTFQALAGNAVVDWLFMLGLAGIGLALTLGIAVRLASHAGALMMILMWLAVLPPEHHPVIDEHVVYVFLLMVIAHTPHQPWSLQHWANKTRLGHILK